MRDVKPLFRVLRIVALLAAVLVYTPINYVHSDYNFYYTQFDRLVKTYCPKITYPNQFVVVPASLDYQVMGVCHGGNHLVGIVRVNKEAWLEMTESGKYELIFHELSHCVLNMDHSDDPRHYMYYADTNLGKEEVIEQTIQSIKSHCTQ